MKNTLGTNNLMAFVQAVPRRKQERLLREFFNENPPCVLPPEVRNKKRMMTLLEMAAIAVTPEYIETFSYFVDACAQDAVEGRL